MTISTRTGEPFGRPLPGRALLCLVICIFANLSMVASDVWAQATATAPLQAASQVNRPVPPALAKTSAVPVASSQPTWQDLTPAQQVSLAPLAAHWSSLDSARKRKWIALAANYSALAPPEQAKLHSRMTEWASLSPKQRDQARLNFAQSKQISRTQKAATWEAYQALSPEERQKLAKSAPPKPTGAATAAKPVAPDKLTKIPLSKLGTRQASEVPVANPAVNRNTLLPHAKPVPAPTPAQNN